MRGWCFNRLEGDSLIQTDSPPVETTSGAGFNRLEGDSLIQTNTAISAATTAFSSFNRLEGDSLIQTGMLPMKNKGQRFSIVSIALRAIL